MENLYYNLAEEEFSKSKKIILWLFSSIFFAVGIGTVFMNVVLKDDSINPAVSIAPFGISIAAGFIAAMATFQRKDHFFAVDDEKIEFRYGMFNAQKKSYYWNNISEILLPHKQKKVKLLMKDNTSVIINLSWIQKKKSSHIRKHIFYGAKEKNINVITPQVLT
jgi:hypothetical protein